MNRITPQDIRKGVETVYASPESTWYKVVETLDNGDELCLAIGMDEGFDEDTVCAKLGVLAGNSAMSDYEWDFVMPYEAKSGSVWDTEVSNPGESDAEWFNTQAEEMIRGLEDGTIGTSLLGSSCGKKKGKKKPVKSAHPFAKPYEDLETGKHQDKMWRGVPGVEMIWHGEWSDPELEYEGNRRNYWDVEDAMYEWAKEDGIDTENDEEFNHYCQEHAYDVYECFSSCGKKKGKKKPVTSGNLSMKERAANREFEEQQKEWYSNRKPIQSMARGYLQPEYDSRASFYNKAEFDDDKLYSYGTLVAEIVDGKPVLYPDWDYSQTTIRHVREFLRQHGFTADSKAQIAKDYLTNSRRPVKSSLNLTDVFYDLYENGYIYEEDENGYNMSYGEYMAISDYMWEKVEEELEQYRDFESAYEAFQDIVNSADDDTKMFWGYSDDDDFYFYADYDNGTYSTSGECPDVLKDRFKEFQQNTELERR